MGVGRRMIGYSELARAASAIDGLADAAMPPSSIVEAAGFDYDDLMSVARQRALRIVFSQRGPQEAAQIHAINSEPVLAVLVKDLTPAEAERMYAYALFWVDGATTAATAIERDKG